MVIRPRFTQWEKHLSRKEAENWDNEQTIIYGRRMAITRARGEGPVTNYVVKEIKDRRTIREKYHLTELTDGWLIDKLCDPNIPAFDAPTYRYVHGILLKDGRPVRT